MSQTTVIFVEVGLRAIRNIETFPVMMPYGTCGFSWMYLLVYSSVPPCTP
jgi:hypothetical protein